VAAIGSLLATCSLTIEEMGATGRRALKKTCAPTAKNRISPYERKGSSVRRQVHRPGQITRLTFSRQGSFSSHEIRALMLLYEGLAGEPTKSDHPLTLEKQNGASEKLPCLPSHDVRLTPRETEVLRWVAQGKRNREIGLILNVSSRTIQKHVQSILDKLSVETRGAAAAWWFEHGT
jgi:DNA-binding CsgD family transcriptional regulator